MPTFKSLYDKAMKRILIALFLAFCAVTAYCAPSRILAHRGGRAEQEENTVEAFKATYKAGCHGFETDIRMTADGGLVIMHDSGLERMTVGGQGRIEDVTADYIRSLNTKGGHKVPFLDDILDFFNTCEDLYVEFEMKTTPELYPEDRMVEYCDKVYEKVMAAKPEGSLYIFTSFDPRPLVYIKGKHPEAEVGYITSKPCSKEVVDYCVGIGVRRIAANVGKTTRKDIEYAHTKGIAVNLWPGLKVEDTLLGDLLGADFLCTDIPVEVMKYVRKHKLDIAHDGPINFYTRAIAESAPALVAGAHKRLVVMDLDGTLSQHKTPLPDQAKAALDRLGEKYLLLMDGGGTAERIHNQMGGYPLDVIGNYGLQEGRVVGGEWTTIRDEKYEIDRDFFDRECARLREKYGYTEYYGDSYEVHPSGMVTFGLLGTAAPKDEKLAFDPNKSKRRAMFKEVCDVFKDYEVLIGGTTSFDITLKKYNKYESVMRYAAEKGISRDEIIFFGDDTVEGGNDSSIRLGGMDYIRVYNYTDFPFLSGML